jgi:ABC-2 type transport system permease protein
VSAPSLSEPATRPAPNLSESLGQPIRGPRALGDSWPRFWHLAYNIARSEFKLKFFGSALGYLWQVVRPLLLFGVLYVFFVLVFEVNKAKGAAAHFYGVQLLASIVLFTCFGEATSGAVRSVVDRENLVRKIQFPRLAIPISVVLLALFNLGLGWSWSSRSSKAFTRCSAGSSCR